MFALSDEDLGLRIVDCGGGPASFAAEATRGGARVVCCDPMYGCERHQIRERIAAIYDKILEIDTAESGGVRLGSDQVCRRARRAPRMAAMDCLPRRLRYG